MIAIKHESITKMPTKMPTRMPAKLIFATLVVVGIAVGLMSSGSVWAENHNANDGAQPSVSIVDQGTNESIGEWAFPVELSEPSNDRVEVLVFSRPLEAQQGQDYYGFSRIVSFPPGSVSQTISVTVLDDDVAEGLERFTVRLANPVNAVIGRGLSTFTINDDDNEGIPRISVSSVRVGEADGSADIRFFLSEPSNDPVSVRAFTRARSAERGRDYYGFSEIVSFAPGQIVQSLPLSIIDDSRVEIDEVLIVNLINPVNALVDSADSLVIIVDDDRANPVRLSVELNTRVTEGTATANVRLFLSAATSETVRVLVFSRSETAQGGSDFYGFTRVVSIEPGQTSTTVPVAIIDDDVTEATEALTIRLTEAVNAALFNSIGTVLIEDDD